MFDHLSLNLPGTSTCSACCVSLREARSNNRSRVGADRTTC